MTLIELVSMGQEDRDVRLAFLGIDQAKRERLSSLTAFVEGIADDLVERFYDHLNSFEGTRVFLSDPALVVRLKRAQRAHLISLTSGAFDEAYFESRLRVGLTHALISLEPQWYIGAYMVQLSIMTAGLFEHFDDPDDVRDSIDALTKAVMLDIELAINAYIYGGFVEKSLADSHRAAAERATAALAARDEQEARKEELLRMVVHDIRSPVTAMMSTARVGLRRASDLTVAPGKQFRLIEDAGVHVLQIIDNMLTIARVTRGQLPISLEAFDVGKVVAECVHELQEYASQAQHTLIYEGDSAVEVEYLDQTLVRRMVFNLATNAIRHTPEATQIGVRCVLESQRCIITVADDGPGLPRNVLEQLDAVLSGTGARSEGAYLDSGLGLPFCALACERLGGRLSVDTTTTTGTRFLIDLPVAVGVLE